MERKYLKGIIAIMLVAVLVLPIMPTQQVKAAGQKANKSWAEVIYENVTIDAGGKVSKVTKESDKKKVIEHFNNNESMMTFYGSRASEIVKIVTSHNRDEVFCTTENTYENSVRIDLSSGGYYVYYWDVVQRDDLNNDGKVTWGEMADSNGYKGYDDVRNLPIYSWRPYNSSAYVFNISNAGNPVTVHLEGRQDVSDFDVTTRTYGSGEYERTYNVYTYKYGKTNLHAYDKSSDEQGNVVFYNEAAGAKACTFFHYNEGTGEWDRVINSTSVGEDGVIKATLSGDGLYICYEIHSNNFGTIIDYGEGSQGEDVGSQMYRIFNPATGEHIYTYDANEVINATHNLGWTLDGTVKGASDATIPVYRLIRNDNGIHIYTLDQNEIDVLVTAGVCTLEGTQFYSVPAGENTSTFYRLSDPTGVIPHHYTNDQNEIQQLVASGVYSLDGPIWYLPQ